MTSSPTLAELPGRTRHNFNPVAYRWKVDGVAILEKIQRARAAQAAAVLLPYEQDTTAESE